MFNVEPQEQLTRQEAAEFEQHVTARHKKMTNSAFWVGGLLLANILCLIPFLAGHSLHRYWESIGRALLVTAFPLFLWFVMRVGFVWSSWQSARETRKEFGDPL